MPGLNSGGLLSSLTSASSNRSSNTASARSMTPNTGGTRVTNVGGTPINRPMGSVNTTNTNLMNESSILSNNNLQNRQMMGKFDSNMMQMSGKLDKMAGSIVGAINQQTALISRIGSGLGNAIGQLPNAIGNVMSQSLEVFSNNFNQMFSERMVLLQHQQADQEGKFFADLKEYQEHFWSTTYKKQMHDFRKMWGEIPGLTDLKNEIIKSMLANSQTLRKIVGYGKPKNNDKHTAAVFTEDYKKITKDAAQKTIKYQEKQLQNVETLVSYTGTILESHISTITDIKEMIKFMVENGSETQKALKKLGEEPWKNTKENLGRYAGMHNIGMANEPAQTDISQFLGMILRQAKAGGSPGIKKLSDWFTDDMSPRELVSVEKRMEQFKKLYDAKMDALDKYTEKQQKQLLEDPEKIVRSYLEKTGIKAVVSNRTDTPEEVLDNILKSIYSGVVQMTSQDVSKYFPTATSAQQAALLKRFNRYGKTIANNQNIYSQRVGAKQQTIDNLEQGFLGNISHLSQKAKLQSEITDDIVLDNLLKVLYAKKGVLSDQDIEMAFPNGLTEKHKKKIRKIIEDYWKKKEEGKDAVKNITGMSHGFFFKKDKNGNYLTDKDGNRIKTSNVEKITAGLSKIGEFFSVNKATEQKAIIDLTNAIKSNKEALEENTDELSDAKGIKDLLGMGVATLFSPKTWMNTLLPIGFKLFKYWSMWKLGSTILDFGRSGLNFVRNSSVGQFAYNNMWMPAKVHIINPLLSGIGSIMEKVVGTERMQYIKNTLGKLADFTTTAWEAVFGVTAKSRSDARTKIMTPIYEALKNFFSGTVVPFLTKMFLMYYSGKKIFGGLHEIFTAGPGNYLGTTLDVLGRAKAAILSPFSAMKTGLGKAFSLKGAASNISWGNALSRGLTLTDRLKGAASGLFSPTINSVKTGLATMAAKGGVGTALKTIGSDLASGYTMARESGAGILGSLKLATGVAAQTAGQVGLSSILAPVGGVLKGVFVGFKNLIPIIGPLSLFATAVNWLNKKAFGKDMDGKKNFNYYVNKMTGFVWETFLGIGKTILGFFKPSNIMAVGKVFLGGLFGLFKGIIKGLWETGVAILKNGFGLVPLASIVWDLGGSLWDWIKGLITSTEAEKKADEISKSQLKQHEQLKKRMFEGKEEKDIAGLLGTNQKEAEVIYNFLNSGTGMSASVGDAVAALAFLRTENMQQLSAGQEKEGFSGMAEVLTRLKGYDTQYSSIFGDSSTLDMQQKYIDILSILLEKAYASEGEERQIIFKMFNTLSKRTDFGKLSTGLRGMASEEELNQLREKVGESEFIELSKNSAKLLEAVNTLRKENSKDWDENLKDNKMYVKLQADIKEQQEAAIKAQEEQNKKNEERNKKAIEAGGSLSGLVDFVQSGELAKWMSDIGEKIGTTVSKLFKFFKDQNWSGMIGSVTQSLGAFSGGLIGGLFGKEDASKFFVKAKKIADDAGLTLMSKFFEAGNNSILGQLEKLNGTVEDIKNNGVGGGGTTSSGSAGGGSGGTQGGASNYSQSGLSQSEISKTIGIIPKVEMVNNRGYGKKQNKTKERMKDLIERHGNYIAKASKEFGVPVPLILGLIEQESGGNPNARSHVGAIGYTQLMPKTAAGLGVNPYNERNNIWGGVKYLGEGFKKYGNWEDALARYNGGHGSVLHKRKYGMYKHAETRNYVPAVLSHAKKWGATMSDLVEKASQDSKSTSTQDTQPNASKEVSGTPTATANAAEKATNTNDSSANAKVSGTPAETAKAAEKATNATGSTTVQEVAGSPKTVATKANVSPKFESKIQGLSDFANSLIDKNKFRGKAQARLMKLKAFKTLLHGLRKNPNISGQVIKAIDELQLSDSNKAKLYNRINSAYGYEILKLDSSVAQASDAASQGSVPVELSKSDMTIDISKPFASDKSGLLVIDSSSKGIKNPNVIKYDVKKFEAGNVSNDLDTIFGKKMSAELRSGDYLETRSGTIKTKNGLKLTGTTGITLGEKAAFDRLAHVATATTGIKMPGDDGMLIKINTEKPVSGHLPAVTGDSSVNAKSSVSDSLATERAKEKAQAESIAEALDMEKTNDNLEVIKTILKDILNVMGDSLDVSKLIGGAQVATILNSTTVNNSNTNIGGGNGGKKRYVDNGTKQALAFMVENPGYMGSN